MIIGVPKEIKVEEYRVSLTPSGTAELAAAGHRIVIEPGAGAGSGFSDDDYRKGGGEIVSPEELFARAELILKVKEPLPTEFRLFRPGQALFTYLHLAPNPELIAFLLERRITALAYETLEKNGMLPLLAPMSEIAGRMAPLVAAVHLQKIHGGAGILPCGAAGVRPAKAVILGAGTVGMNAARVALGLGMETVVLNRGSERLQRLDEMFGGRVATLAMTRDAIREEIATADVVVGAVLVPGGRTPILIRREMLAQMKRGAVIVDVTVDQGGCTETTVPTTHDRPVYEVGGVLHYAVANMPGAYPRTSTLALTNATLPYVKSLADLGIEEALAASTVVATALNIRDGVVVHPQLRQFVAG